MSSLLFSSLHNDAVPAFAAATHQARQMFSSNSRNTNSNMNSNSSRRCSTDKDESKSNQAIFDEFGAFEQAQEQEQPVYTNEIEAEDDEDDEEIRRLTEQIKRGAMPTQKNSPGLSAAAKACAAFKQEPKIQEPYQKASPKAAIAPERSVKDETKESDQLPSAALSRMRYYRKVIPAPKPRNTSPKSDPQAGANHLSKAAVGTQENRRFSPSSQSAAAILYHSNRSLPIAIPLKKLSPTNDDGHRFRAELHPRIAADSSFILPAASYLPSILHKSFVPKCGSEHSEENGDKRKKNGDSLKGFNTSPLENENEKDEPFGFEFEMDM